MHNPDSNQVGICDSGGKKEKNRVTLIQIHYPKQSEPSLYIWAQSCKCHCNLIVKSEEQNKMLVGHYADSVTFSKYQAFDECFNDTVPVHKHCNTVFKGCRCAGQLSVHSQRKSMQKHDKNCCQSN